MKTKLFLIIILFALSSCVNTPYPRVVKKSLYLNKPLMKFEMDNGYTTLKKKLDNGSYIYTYRSDQGSIMANLFDFEGYPPCILEIKTNKDKIIKEIKIIEDDIKCAYILK